MKKNDVILQKRRAYIKDMLSYYSERGFKTEFVVTKLAEKLFLSESTIWKELKK